MNKFASCIVAAKVCLVLKVFSGLGMDDIIKVVFSGYRHKYPYGIQITACLISGNERHLGVTRLRAVII